MIAIEYFRFETWLQQSGSLVTDLATGEFTIGESSLRRAILLASDARCLTMDYVRVERHVLMVISQAHRCLLMLQALREKYSLHDKIDHADASDSATLETSQEIPSATSLFKNDRIGANIDRDAKLRQRRAKTVSFFRKVNFAWSFKDDMSDRAKVMEHVQTLKSCNDALLECLPMMQQDVADRLVNMKMLALSALPSDLEGLGSAASTFTDRIHTQIYQAMVVKSRRVNESTQGVSIQELQQIELDLTAFSFQEHDLDVSTMTPSRIIGQYAVKGSPTNEKLSIMLENVSFPPSLTEDDLKLLEERIALLCMLLRSAGHPYFPVLPLGIGFMPSLEQRYELASALANGVLSLLSVNWLHKAITSRNVVVYRRSGHLDLASPQLSGFGLARPERPGERSIDLRDRALSPWRFWQHPELRSAGQEHRRFERRFDVFSLGVVLFEIGMWQDIHFYSSSGSGTTAVNNADDFRRRLVTVCSQEMAHKMGEVYKSAVMACLDGDEIWTGQVSHDIGMQIEQGIQNGDKDVTELFYLHVSSVLRSCCKET
ncbi:hypothetical protein NW762_010264 [Fusarium torreyae]|uniref:Protein kinase domain-containing protein n=1 Tax=Fusarium torreyae TaxID=1237075 RepID=A0A9W8RUJ9_9HYPO|nr:hypothetical protein NW762_010264 [Fusarium torreyae]